MAVCQMWDVRGRLDHPLDYATNAEKTTRPELSEEAVQGLRDVMDYASNSEKTYDTDEQRFLSTINCNILTARQDMLLTKREWKDNKDIIAFHGFQSFKHGEVTPDIAHEIGVRLAEKMWGDRFEVVVSTHLNTECLHNHFVINSTSFVDGKRFYDNKDSLKRLRAESDKLCKEYQLSVIDNPDNQKSHKYLHKADKAGMPTRHNTLAAAIDDAIAHSFTKNDFFKQMIAMGYRCDFRESRKYATIIPKGYEKSIRVHKLGDEYTRERIFARIAENGISVKATPIQPATKCTGYRNVTAHSIFISQQKGGMRGLYLHYCYRLGILPKNTNRNNARVHYLLKEDLMKLDRISAQTKLLYKYHIDTAEQLFSFKEGLQVESETLKNTRQKLWNQSRSVTDPDAMSKIKEDIAKCSGRLKEIRTELKHCDEIASRSGIISENLKQVEVDEKTKQGKEKTTNEQFRRRR